MNSMTLPSANTARENMLKSQILPGHVLEERLLGALGSVARESFVPEAIKGSAYVDEDIPLGGGRFLMEPLTFARLLTHAAIKPHEMVLDIGAASGYSAAVIAHLAQKVVAVEEDAGLVALAKATLAAYPNVEYVQAPLAQGLSGRGPYDVIIIEGAIEVLPQALADQLCEGGRILACEHDAAPKTSITGLGKLVEYKKVRGMLYKTVLRDASVALLAAFAKPKAFAF